MPETRYRIKPKQRQAAINKLRKMAPKFCDWAFALYHCNPGKHWRPSSPAILLKEINDKIDHIEDNSDCWALSSGLLKVTLIEKGDDEPILFPQITFERSQY